MTELAQTLARLAVDLRSLRVRWALIGGVAVSVRAVPRTTLDLDLAVAVTNDREAEALVRSLIATGYRHEAFHLEHEHGSGRLAMVRLSAGPPVPIDLLFASSGIEQELVDRAESLEALPGVVVPVALVEDLIALKVLSGRIQDQADVAALLSAAPAEQRETTMQRAREMLALIHQRGFDRGRDLEHELGQIAARALGPGV